MSASSACASPPASRIRRTTGCNPARCRETSTKRAPWRASSSAKACPKPRLAPVIIVAVPEMSMSSCLSLENLDRACHSVGIPAGILANYHSMGDDLGSRLARNVRELRLARGFTQEQMAKLAGVPRATWSNLESGSGNPTLTVLHAVCNAFQVSLEEIVAQARANARLYPKGSLPLRTRGEVQVSSLLPDEI